MPRQSRFENQKSNINHIILRGIDKQAIFYEKNDNDKFLSKFKTVNIKYNTSIYAYTLMTNHVHFVINDEKNNLSNFMHDLCTSYAKYFNEKYERVGHLFQNRFKNICVNNERYLLNLIRYIHKNPEKECISKMEDYEWSSYKEYIGKEEIIDSKFVLGIFDTDINKAINKFVEFNKGIERTYSDSEFEREKMTDEEAIENIRRILKIDNLQVISKLNREEQKKYIKAISEINGIYVEQMSRILGINKYLIYRIRKNNDK